CATFEYVGTVATGPIVFHSYW
nr:immunoglobulin heavy chain junction region [Macaca mulatta]MOW46885.1 immunoglobulin heavy chain junction region [Macaca mulatta]MOW47212.1 immunoglobulin heavy chain junction region [Macaca mulatta]MOW47942.1 immunoglobulin heavy chain junction region [Macaca mulatta]MOW48142.1 immunoglobulin heavy chain junction region [Macaca mulatta]